MPSLSHLPDWIPGLSDQQLADFEMFHVELLKFNPKLNLVSPATLERVEELHFADSILGARVVLENTEAEEIYDIGSGNGFPGLILAVLDRERSIHLVESDIRKAEFIKHVRAKLGIRKGSVLNKRFEQLPENSIQTATCRAFAPLERALKWGSPVLTENAEFYHLKSTAIESEIAEIPEKKRAQWDFDTLAEFKLPESGDPRFVVVSRRKCST